MRLALRLWLLGAVVPCAGMVAATAVGAHFFRGRLLRALDDALLEQAAVESVSLFDGPGGRAHLHQASSPLRGALRGVLPAAALYDRSGEPVQRDRTSDGRHATDERLVPSPRPTAPVLATRETPGAGSDRVMTVSLLDPQGEPWALQLVASLAPLDAATATFLRVGMQLSLALGLALLALQTLQARRLSARVNALTRHVAALREGDLSAVPPAPAGGDEIADLSRVVAEATEQLRKARAAQDRLVADAAHELRTPLSLMRTSIDLALRRRREVPELRAALEEARNEVDRLARLSTRLLDLAAAGRGEWDRAPGDLRRTAEEAAEGVRAEAEAKGVLVEVRGEGPLPAHFDPGGIRQALDNLLTNAVRHSPAGRPVAVELACEAGVARIAVRDGGPGIPAPERERVFLPFHRAGDRAGAAGLGLAIVREIARGHGGRAYVGEGGPGAEVVLELPTG